MRPIPAEHSVDSSLSLFTEGYRFVQNRCRRHGSDIFTTRLLLRKTICMLGEDAARIFYDEEKFLRHGAMPGRVQKTLLGVAGVQSLDAAAHEHRKHMFVELLMAPGHIAALLRITENQWRAAFSRWQARLHGSENIVLFAEVQEIFCRAICEWAGVPLPQADVQRRTRDFAALIDSAGRLGSGYWRGRFARRRCDRWAAALITQVRNGTLMPDKQSALGVVALFQDMHGKRLPAEVAAVELINILRPTVAIARFVIFGALALHEHPHCRQEIAAGDDAYLENFVQEVRRFYPFFPFLAAHVRQAFDWNGYHFPQGRRVMLDLYGTNHDPRSWQAPDEFRLERFATEKINAYNFIPNGGGDYRLNHRCPGEWITVALMKQAMQLLTQTINYRVPPQDLTVRLSKMPTLPASGFAISDVKPCARQ